MKVSVYAATCPQCGHRAVVHSRNQPPGCACSLYSKKGCDGILGPWMFIAETETRVENIEDIGSVTLGLGGMPVFHTEPMPTVEGVMPRNNPFDRYSPPGVTMEDVEIDQLRAEHALEIQRFKTEHAADVEEIRQLRGWVAERDARIEQLQWQVTKLQQELDARQGEPKVYDAAMNARDHEIARLKNHVARQDHMLDNAASLLEAGATMTDTVQKALDKAEAKLEQCEAALTEARTQRDYNAKCIDRQTETIDQLRQDLAEAIRKLHE